MQRRTLLRALGGLAVGSAVASPTTAQEESTPTTTTTSTATPAPTGDPEPAVEVEANAGPEPTEPTRLAALDPTTDILDYRVHGVEDGRATMTITLDARTPGRVTMADSFAGLVSEGVTTIPVKEVNIPRGTVKVSMETTVWREETTGVTMATPRSERPVTISTGLPEKSEPETSLWNGTSAGITVTILGTALAAHRKVSNKNDAPEPAIKTKGKR